MAVNRRTRAASESLGFLAVTGGVLILVNVLGMFGHWRLDCTEKRLFSLSEGSERLASELNDTMEITAYFTEDLPYPFNNTERYVLDILEEYEAAAEGNIVIRVVHPEDEEEQQAAEEAGVRKVSHQVVENDSVSIREGYRGLVMRYLDQTEVIPVIEDTSGLEYKLTTKIKEMVGETRPVGILSGHEGPTPTEGLTRIRQCLPTYELRTVSADSEIDEELAALLVVEPKSALSQTELRYIDKYVMEGGSLGVFGGSMQITIGGQGQNQMPTPPTSSPIDTGVNRLLRPWGAAIQTGLVADAQCGRAPMRTRMGVLPVPHPPVPIVSFDEAATEHAVLFRLDSAPIPFTSPVDVVGSGDDTDVTVLARSSENSWLLEGESIALQPRMPREWQQGGGQTGPFPLMLAIEGPIPSAFAAASGPMSSPEEEEAADAPDVDAPERSTDDARVLVVGSGFVLRDEIMGQPQQGQDPCEMTSTLALGLNAIDWLAQDSDLIAIRAKNVEDPQIEVPQDVREAEEEARTAAQEAQAAAQQGDEATAQEAVEERDEALERRKEALASWETKKKLYRWSNMLGIPILFGLFGLLRWQMRINKRKNLKL